jgi:uncharacterized protein
MEIFSGIILFLAGIGAGVMTGLIGASAGTFMAGILITVLGFGAYFAIGLSLLTDVSASLTSAWHYNKTKNVNLRHGMIMGAIAIIFSFAGSRLALHIPEFALNDALGIMVLLTGIKFIKDPFRIQGTKLVKFFEERKRLSMILIGSIVGLVSGVLGMGGGIAIVITLTLVLGYSIKRAVGTSVIIMAFISLAGGMGHFIKTAFPWQELILTSAGAIVGAIIASKYVNKISEKTMFTVAGIILIILSLLIIFQKFFTGMVAPLI